MTVNTIVHLDGNDKKITFERVQDVEPILDANKAAQNERQTPDGFHYVGEIPNVILERWLNEEYVRGNTSLTLGSHEFNQIIMRKLRSSEWQWLRTTSKRF